MSKPSIGKRVLYYKSPKPVPGAKIGPEPVPADIVRVGEDGMCFLHVISSPEPFFTRAPFSEEPKVEHFGWLPKEE